MKLGTCYYPEHWPQERWQEDAVLMRKLGLSLVRIADFAWAVIEPREDKFTWDWLDQAIEVLAAEHLEIILCTPTASPPPWLCKAYPEILPVDAQGRHRRYGSRRHYCPNSTTYQQHTARIASALGARYGGHPAIVGWQIDNEFGCHDTARCYCEKCASAFRSWLEAKYESLDALNEAWGSVFWSQIYGEWSEIDPPNLTIAEPNPSHVLDYYRFSSDSFVTYQQLQITALQPYISEKQFVTTNFMSQYSDLDYYNLAKPLDFVTMSSYPTGHAESKSALYMSTSRQPVLAYDVGDPYLTGMGHALMRGFKQGIPFWVMEQQCGNVNWSQYNTGIRPGTVQLWTWHALASGAESVIYFRWRAGLYAQEQHHSGLLKHDASPAVGYSDLEAMQAERTLMSEISAFPKEAQIALLLDYDTLWALRLQPHHHEIDYMRLLFVYYRALERLGYPADIVSIDADLSPYRLVIVPTAFVATEQTTRSLKDYAEGGGTVLLGVRSGFKTASNRVNDHPLPGLLGELAGLTVMEWHALPPGVSYGFNSSIPGLDGPATVWAEALNLQLDGSKVTGSEVQILAQYKSSPFNDDAALVEHKYGSGSAFYLGWYPTDQQAMALLSYLASQCEIPSIATIPDGLIISKRGPYLILLNFTDETLSATVQGKQIEVRPRDVQVVDTL